jgi:hypothetical protein
VHDSGVPEQAELPEAETMAELVKVPRSPKKNPDIAVAAIRVTAIIMTVARTGEIAFLFLECVNNFKKIVRRFGY